MAVVAVVTVTQAGYRFTYEPVTGKHAQRSHRLRRLPLSFFENRDLSDLTAPS
ncbi:MAG: hypothetical protein ACLSVD_17230 [Eggerthellaceae bacterium]